MHLIIPKQIYGSKYGATCHSISLLLCSTHALSHRPPFKKLTFFTKKIYTFLKHTILVTVYITLGLFSYSFGLIHLIMYFLADVGTNQVCGACCSAQMDHKPVSISSEKQKTDIKEFTVLIYTVVLVLLLTIWWVEKKTTETYIFRDKIFFTKIV